MLTTFSNSQESDTFWGIQYLNSIHTGNQLYCATVLISSEGYVTPQDLLWPVSDVIPRIQGCFNGVKPNTN